MNYQRFVTRLAVLFALLAGCIHGVVLSQEEPKLERTLPTPQDVNSQQTEPQDDPSTVFLRDADGQPIAVPRLQYQQFYDYLQKQFEASQRTTEVASLESLQLDGVVAGDFVAVTIRLQGVVKEDLIAPVMLPIQLSNLVIKSFEATGEYPSRLAPGPMVRELEDSTIQESAEQSQAQLSLGKSRGLVWLIEPRLQQEEMRDDSSLGTCQLFIEGFIPISRTTTRQVTFDFPPVASQTKLKLPITSQEIDWIGDSNQRLTQTASETSIDLERVGFGDFSQLAWADVGDLEEVLSTEVNSNTRFIANAEGRPWIATTKLSLKPGSIPAARDFVIQLPENSTWTPAVESSTRGGWTIVSYPRRDSTNSIDTEMSSTKSNRLLLRASAEELSRSNSSIEIRWTWQPPEKLDQDFSLQTIAVENAQRHEGTIEVLLPSSVQFTWKADRSSGLSKRLMEPGMPELFNYAFSFNKTPVEILCKLRESGLRLEYRPEFLVQLKADSIELTGLLNFAVDPSQMVGLEIHLGNWAVKQIAWAQSGQLIDYQQVSPGLIRFDPAGLYRRADTGNAVSSRSMGRTIQLELVKNYQSTEDPRRPLSEIMLPSIEWLDDQGSSVMDVGNGWVSVSSNDWHYERSDVNLRSLTAVESVPLNLAGLIDAKKLTSVDSYVFNQKEGEPKWSAVLNRKPNLATQFVETQISFDDASYRLQKKWKIEQNKWKDLSFAFYLPEQIAQDLTFASEGGPQERRALFTINGERVQCERIEKEPDSPEDTTQPSAPDAVVELEAVGRDANGKTEHRPRVGWTLLKPILDDLPAEFELKLDVALPIPQNDAAMDVESTQFPIEIPYLIASSPLMTIDRQLAVTIESTWRAKIQARDQEVIVFPGQTLRPRKLADSVYSLAVELERLSTVESAAVRVHQIWLQTALNGSERMDRCVFDLSTASDQIELQFDASEINNLTSVLVNGQRVDPQRIEGTHSLVLMLNRAVGIDNSPVLSTTNGTATSINKDMGNSASQRKSKRYTIELWLWSTVSRSLAYRVLENCPAIVDAKEPAPKYWQLIVPQQDHLWTKTTSLMPEYKWRWSGLSLRRQTELRQTELEQMMHASEQAEFGLDANHYLFSSLATSLDPLNRTALQSIYIVPRYVLFAPVGLLCILVACLLVYVPWLRNVWVAGLVSICGVGVAAISIDLAILLFQCIGGAAIFVAALVLVRWSIGRRVDQRSVFANRSRMMTSTVTPVAPVDFGEDDADGSQGSTGGSMIKNANSVIGTTRSLQSVVPNDPDVTVDLRATSAKVTEESVGGTTP